MLLLGLVILSPCIWLVNRPKPVMISIILALVVSGVYSIHQSVFDLGIVLTFGVLGYLMRMFTIPILPIVLGIVLGFLVESNYRRSMLISGGDHGIFIEDKVSLLLLCLAIALTAYTLVKEFKISKKNKA